MPDAPASVPTPRRSSRACRGARARYYPPRSPFPSPRNTCETFDTNTGTSILLLRRRFGTVRERFVFFDFFAIIVLPQVLFYDVDVVTAPPIRTIDLHSHARRLSAVLAIFLDPAQLDEPLLLRHLVDLASRRLVDILQNSRALVIVILVNGGNHGPSPRRPRRCVYIFEIRRTGSPRLYGS